MGRSILAVILGYLVVAIATMVTFAIAFPNPDSAQLPSISLMLFLLGAGVLYTIIGGYVTAFIARKAEIKHTLALGSLMVILGIISMIATFGKEPLWFQLVLIITPIPSALAGGYLRIWRSSSV